ncbi:class I SAM-dependent methyltransferase [Opitutaceae bacterium EW11]|nr:class I SAM-dependent methyltransferase [Opitutaceae bacterium EW11]
MSPNDKSTVEEIRSRFDRDVERFSNLETGQTATMDAAYCLDLVSRAACAATPRIGSVLDVGCGAGNFSLKLRERAPDARFTLVDLSRPMLDRAQERLGASAVAAHAGDIRSIDFPDASFDVIVAAAVLHHLRTPEEWRSVFDAFRRWLRPGGSVWVFDLVSHEHSGIEALLWHRYGDYLEQLGGAVCREKVFAYVQKEDTPTPVTYQLELLRAAGFDAVDLLHKNACFAAFGAVRR